MAVVEFQPSSFGKGSYLNVAAHWFWSAMPDVLSFDYSLPREKFWIGFRDAEQFGDQIAVLAQRAADDVRQLDAKLSDIRTVARLLVVTEEQFKAEGRGGGWPAFHAAMAAGASGDMTVARTLFASARESIASWRPDVMPFLDPFAAALEDEAAFARFVAQRIDAQRALYGFGPRGIAIA
jgi:hypothetical protein